MKLDIGTKVLLSTVGGVRLAVVESGEKSRWIVFKFIDGKKESIDSTRWRWLDTIKDCTSIPTGATEEQIKALRGILEC